MIQNFIRAVSKPKEYKQFLTQSYISIIGTLLLVVLVFNSIPATRTFLDAKKIFDTAIETIKTEIPEFTISYKNIGVKDNVKVDKEVNGYKILVDTENVIADEKIKSLGDCIVIDKEIVYIKMPNTGQLTVSSKNEALKEKDMQMDKAKFVQGLSGTLTGNAASVYFTFVTVFLTVLVIAGIITAIAFIYVKRSFLTLKFGDVFKLSLYAMMLPTILVSLISLLPKIPMGTGEIITIGLGLGYVIVGLNEIKNDRKYLLPGAEKFKKTGVEFGKKK